MKQLILILTMSLLPTLSLASPAKKLSEKEFHRIIDIARPLFVDKASSNGIKLTVKAMWENKIPNAETLVLGSSASISIYGGLVSLDGFTREAFSVVLCHELGHVLAGAPYFGDFNNSVEGGADYYSSNDCLKELLPLLNFDDSLKVSQEVHEICIFQEDILTCKQTLMGGFSLMNALALRSLKDIPLSYRTPDSSLAPATLKSYPSFQCRLDSILRGYFNLNKPACWFNKNDPNNDRDSSAGSITI